MAMGFCVKLSRPVLKDQRSDVRNR